MEPLMSTTCETSIATIPMDIQRKSLIDITPIPKRNTSHCQVNMMSQGETSNTQMYQNNNTNMMFNSQGRNQTHNNKNLKWYKDLTFPMNNQV